MAGMKKGHEWRFARAFSEDRLSRTANHRPVEHVIDGFAALIGISKQITVWPHHDAPDQMKSEIYTRFHVGNKSPSQPYARSYYPVCAKANAIIV